MGTLAIVNTAETITGESTSVSCAVIIWSIYSIKRRLVWVLIIALNPVCLWRRSECFLRQQLSCVIGTRPGGYAKQDVTSYSKRMGLNAIIMWETGIWMIMLHWRISTYQCCWAEIRKRAGSWICRDEQTHTCINVIHGVIIISITEIITGQWGRFSHVTAVLH